MKAYVDRLIKIETLKELFDFKIELGIEYEVLKKCFQADKDCSAKPMLDAGFILERIDARIAHLESEGVFLDKIIIKQNNKTK